MGEMNCLCYYWFVYILQCQLYVVFMDLHTDTDNAVKKLHGDSRAEAGQNFCRYTQYYFRREHGTCLFINRKNIGMRSWFNTCQHVSRLLNYIY